MEAPSGRSSTRRTDFLAPPLAGHSSSAFNCSELQFFTSAKCHQHHFLGKWRVPWVTGAVPTPPGLTLGLHRLCVCGNSGLVLTLCGDRGVIVIPCQLMGRTTQGKGDPR